MPLESIRKVKDVFVLRRAGMLIFSERRVLNKIRIQIRKSHSEISKIRAIN